ncbi:HAD family hydrolase [Paenibacillus psychroresistens]|uniref:D,D-heptose 1,7-bisphosphate phosphatase n=1 Tax=Paenibacillus psychroresistens TaxID=1778678 RepID=A0A6B8RF99_9BACL|nr:HAD family hydrolase [Paenibacillus psychroresistens]QGQ94819.1 HAD family hydrolase [Paenibacillus psychroresistens]
MAHKAVFLDRDGVINEVQSGRVGFVNSADDVYLLPGSAEAIKLLNANDYKVYIVTNQGGIGLGFMSEVELMQIHTRLLELLNEEAGARIDDIAYCPNKPQDNSSCRKPKPTMIIELAHKHDIDLKRSFTIGDMRSDIASGNEAGTSTFLILEKDEVIPMIDEKYVATSLKDAVKQILQMG